MPALTLVAPTASNALKPELRSTVLTANVIARLHALNTVARYLRSCGYRITDQSLSLGKAASEIHIDQGKCSLVPLLDSGRGTFWRPTIGKRIGYTSLHGVAVRWEEV